MNKRIGSGAAVVILALAAGLLLGASPGGTQHRLHPSRSWRARSVRPPVSAPTPHRRTATPDRPRHTHEGGSSARPVARSFLDGWLSCAYHQGPCARLGGTLPAYAAALARQHARSLPTPAELTARPRVVSLQFLRACGQSATAIAIYRDGEGGRFELHISLIRQRKRWEVFDVAEAAPHIPLPKALNHGPGRC